LKQLFALAFGFATAALAVFKLLPWWAGVGLLACLAVSGRLLAATLFRRFLPGMFEAKSAVLRGARARVHAVTPAPEPKGEFDDEFADGFASPFADADGDAIEPTPGVWRYVDVTIEVPERGSNQDSAMTMWDPGELMIVEPRARPGKAANLDGFDDHLGGVHSVDVMQGGNWVALDGDKLLGTQRVRLHVDVRPGADLFKLRYYFEILKNAEPGTI